MYKKTVEILAVALAVFGTASPSMAATTIAVRADKPSGTYDAPFDVRIQASDPAAKIWYAFGPNVSPGDALPYSKPVRITKSTPFLFFAYTDYQHESKIERHDYVVKLPGTLRFQSPSATVGAEDSSLTATIENYGSSAVPLSGWKLRSSRDVFEVQRQVSVAAGSETSFGPIGYSDGAVTLESPDGEIVATLTVTREAPKPKPVEIRAPKTTEPAEIPEPATVRTAAPPSGEAVKLIETPVAVTTETVTPNLPTTDPNSSPVAVEPVAVEPVAVEPVAVEPVTVEPVTASPPQSAAPSDDASIKLSATESRNAGSSGNKAVAAGILAILAWGAWVRGFLEWRKRKGA